MDEITSTVQKYADKAKDFLMESIAFESTPGNEKGVIEYCRDRFAEAGCDCEEVGFPPDFQQDPEYSHPAEPHSYKGRANLVARRHGTGGGRSTILQSHVDVVPAEGWEEAFTPKSEGGKVIGRGSLDAKGQVAAIYLAMLAIDKMGLVLSGDVMVQVVVEEEVGGNGALSLIRQGYLADAALICEGTDLYVHPANRGAIWFKLEIEGRATHMGRKHEGISAIDLGYKAIQALYEYEELIVKRSAGYPGFERYERPVQVNIGSINAGKWPSMVAGTAVIEGGVGFLPNMSMKQVKEEVDGVIRSIDDNWLRSHYKLTFPKLHNDSFETDYSHPMVADIAGACKESGLPGEVFGWNVSCDARLYSRIGRMPTVVFGPGSISQAHAREESIDFADIVKAAEVIVRYAQRWCG